jgi:hypothetical protein
MNFIYFASETTILDRHVKQGIDCARPQREAMFVALPRKVDTMLPPAAEQILSHVNLARVEQNRSSSLFRVKGLPRFDARHEHGY